MQALPATTRFFTHNRGDASRSVGGLAARDTDFGAVLL
jgi:hypothetical protein